MEVKNKLGVKVKSGKYNIKYYPKQNFNYEGVHAEEYEGQELFFRNTKTVDLSFTVTYPKTCKDVCVGIGFSSLVDNTFNEKNRGDNRYWNGKIPYGKTLYYKKGKKTVAYMRLG